MKTRPTTADVLLLEIQQTTETTKRQSRSQTRLVQTRVSFVKPHLASHKAAGAVTQVQAVKSRPQKQQQPFEKDAKQPGPAHNTRHAAKRAAKPMPPEPPDSHAPSVPHAITSTSSLELSTSSSSVPADWPAEEVTGPASKPGRKRHGLTGAAHRSRGIFLCGRRRIFFSTRPRTTTYRPRSCAVLPGDPSNGSQKPCHEDDPPLTDAKCILARSPPTNNLVTSGNAAKTIPAAHPMFASPPFAASHSQLHSVQTGLHVKRLAADNALDSCKPDVAGARLTPGPAHDPCGLQPQHLRLQDELGSSARNAAEDAGGAAVGTGLVNAGTDLPRTLPAEPGAHSPSLSQAVSDWSNAPSASWSSWLKKGYTINVLVGAEAESSLDHAMPKAQPSSTLFGPDSTQPDKPEGPGCQRKHAQGAVAVDPMPEEPSKTAGPGPYLRLPPSRVPTDGRQRRASDPYPSAQADAHIHPEGSPLKKVCLNSPGRLSPQEPSPGMQKSAALQAGLMAQGRAWGVHRSGYKSLLSILDSAPSDLPLSTSRSLHSPCPRGSPHAAGQSGHTAERPGQEHRRAVSLPSPLGEFGRQSSDRQVQEVMPMPASEAGPAPSAGRASQADLPLLQVAPAPALGCWDAPPGFDPSINLPYPPMAPPPLNASAAQAFRLRRLGQLSFI